MSCCDVLVVGAGIVGCACARECALAGMRVTIVEPGVPGGAATAAGMGHVVVMDDTPAQLALTGYSRSLWQALAPALPASAEYEQRGTIWVAGDEEEMAEVSAKHRTYSAAGLQAEVLDSRQLAAAEPNLRAGLAGGLFVPGDAVLYPPAAAAYFLREALGQGAELLRGRSVVSIGTSPGASTGTSAGVVTLDDGTRLPAAAIVLATGADQRLVPELAIARRKGHLVITDRYPGFVNHQLVELGYLKSAHRVAADSVAFNVQPRRTGQILIGSSRQYGSQHGGRDPAVEPQILAAMLARAQRYMPGLARLSSIRAWTGFRAATPDKLPLLGPTARRGLYLAMGFEGLGITHAAGAARLLLAHLTQGAFAIDPAPYLPERVQAPEPSLV